MTDFNFLEGDTEKIEFIQSIGKLIENGQIPVELLNENLANCFSISRYLITLYEETTFEYENLKTEFDIWYSEIRNQFGRLSDEPSFCPYPLASAGRKSPGGAECVPLLYGGVFAA